MAFARFRKTVKRILFHTLYYSGVERVLVRLLRANAAVVVMYHGVCSNPALPAEVCFHLSPELFARHLAFLTRRYRIISLRQLLDRLERGERLNQEVVLTFDDGYRNNLLYAAPLCRKFSVPFTVFLTTHHVERQSWMPLNELYALWWAGKLSHARMTELRARIRSLPIGEAAALLDGLGETLTPQERASAGDSFNMLSWAEARELEAQGDECGSHTHTHCNMAAETPERQREELLLSKRLLEEQLHRPVDLFAYPFGKARQRNAASRENVQAAGYRCALAAEGGPVQPGEDPYCLPRISYVPEPAMFAVELLLRLLRCRFGRRARLAA
jgi:peptidoglycan/xylan/chitin deacetylase (PgdA/CDA1 family)